MCTGEANYRACVAEHEQLYSPSIHWLPLIAEVAAGVAAIWGVLLIIQWIKGNAR
jgi:hypothetical protein